MKITKEEQYTIVKYLYNKGKTNDAIHKDLISICGSDALDFHIISLFVLRLKYNIPVEARQSSEDERIDQTSRFKVKIVILKHCRASIDFICARTNIPYERVVEIINNLKLTNVHTRWMPMTFDIKNKLQRVMHCSNMLLRHLSERDFLERMIIMQEIWLPVFNMKKESSQCFSFSLRKDFPRFTHENKLIRVIFWDQKGVIFDYSIQKNTSVIYEEYQNIIKNHLVPTIAKVRPKLVDKIILYHDNIVLGGMSFGHNEIERIIVSYNSPDLFPGDFWFNRALRLSLEQKEYPSMSHMESAIQNWYKEIPVKTFEHKYKMMIIHWEQCLNDHGESLVNM